MIHIGKTFAGNLERVHKAVILAAGKGSRLYPITHHIAKPLLPIANKPTMYYAFERLAEMQISDVCVVVGENEGEMKSFLEDKSSNGINISYAKQNHPKGLADGVAAAKEFVAGEPFVLYLGDSIYSEGFESFAERFRRGGIANLNIVAEVEDPRRFGVATLDGDRIVNLVEKPVLPESNWAMAGLYFFGPEIWDVLQDLKPSARGEYEITDAIQLLIDHGAVVEAGKYGGVWFDTGTRESFLETSFFLSGEEARIDPSASVKGHVGVHVVIGEGATVECESIANSVVLPNARITGDKRIFQSILGGSCALQDDAISTILWDGKPRE